MDNLYGSHFTKRFHTRSTIPSQTVGEHTFGMFLILYAEHPNPSLNLIKAITLHDLHEFHFGDVPSYIKIKYPDIEIAENNSITQFYEVNDIEEINLTIQEKLWLKYLDKAEICFYLNHIGLTSNEQKLIYKDAYEKATELKEQLKTFGFFKDPEETVH